MSVQLISNDLLEQFNELLENTKEKLYIISPFIGMQTASLLAKWLKNQTSVKCVIITRFYREEFVENISSLHGLEQLLHAGAEIYALLDLHSKVYVFDDHSSIIGSANFTHGGFVSNFEVSVLMEQEYEITEKCIEYASDLVNRIKNTGNGIIDQTLINKEMNILRDIAPNRKNKTTVYSNNHKEGASLPKLKKKDLFEEIIESSSSESKDLKGCWLKFEGQGEDRVPNHLDYHEIKGRRKRDLNQTFFPKRPSGVKEGDLLFLTIVSYDKEERPTPLIIGYAYTNGYKSKNAVSDLDLQTSPWKVKYPYYLEYSNGKVMNSSIKNGIRLIDVYNSLGKLTYPSLKNKKNTSLKNLYSMHFRRSHIRVTEEAKEHILEELNKLFKKYGYITLG